MTRSCPLGGVGKTTLVTHVHNELLNRPNVCAIWVTVSQNFSIFKLQDDLARALGTDLGGEDDERKKAAIIARGLKRRDIIVLILDDLWNVFFPEWVGIEMRGGCKVIFTTWSSEVCDRMACGLKIEVVPLNEEEAWMLFTRTIGTSTTLVDPAIEEMAKCLTRECAGLPLWIIAVAGSMRGVNDIREWRDALEAMRSQYVDIDLQLEQVFRILRYSYEALKNQTLQECFLYCSLFPEDYKIRRRDLIGLFVDEGLINGLKTSEAEFNRGHTILNKLEKVCLLQGEVDFSKIKYVKMHDLVRDMALRISIENHRFWVEAGSLGSATEVVQKRWSPNLERVSFISSDILDVLSDVSPPRCPRLSTLLWHSCRNMYVIPNHFIAHMIKLAVLDLSCTSIVELPKSISDLKCLTALLLNRCSKLQHLVPLSDLRALRRLDLSYTGIREVPQGMEMLVNLRDLNLSGVVGLEIIPQGILSKLSNLHHLAVPRLKVIVQEIAEEISSLQKLERFQGCFYDTVQLDTLLRSWKHDRRPKEYILAVDSRTWHDFHDSEVQKYVYIRGCHELISLCELQSLSNASDLRKSHVSSSSLFPKPRRYCSSLLAELA